MSTATGIVQRPPVFDALDKAKTQLEGRLPKGMTVDRFMYGVSTAIQKNPGLLNCEPKSVLLAAYEAAECGCDLSPSKAMGWLIPYGKACNFQPSYRFFIQEAYRSGVVKAFNSEVVRANDVFKIIFAPQRTVIHEPKLGDRGEPVGAYAVIQFLDDHLDFEYCTLEEIEKHRKHSKQPDSLMWREFWNEGARKTAVRLLAKRLPQTNPAMERLAELIQKDADDDIVIPGALELEPDSPMAAPKAQIPTYTKAAHSELNEHNGEGVKSSNLTTDKTPSTGRQHGMPPVAPAGSFAVHYYVGNILTFISGNVRALESDFKSLNGEPSKEKERKGQWTIPAGRTDDLVKLCDEKSLPCVEVDDKGTPFKSDLFEGS